MHANGVVGSRNSNHPQTPRTSAVSIVVRSFLLPCLHAPSCSVSCPPPGHRLLALSLNEPPGAVLYPQTRAEKSLAHRAHHAAHSRDPHRASCRPVAPPRGRRSPRRIARTRRLLLATRRAALQGAQRRRLVSPHHRSPQDPQRL